MAKEQGQNTGTPAPPVLVRPRQGEDVAPDSVTFRWEDVEGDVEFWLQVSSDEDFSDTVLDVNVGESLAYTVNDLMQATTRPYFWRVRARDIGGAWGDFSEPESFLVESISEHEAQVAAVENPNETEDLGPVAEMLKGIKAEVGAEFTGDPEYFQQEIEMGVAHEGLGAGQILGFVFAIITALIMIIVFAFFLVGASADKTYWETVEQENYPQLRETEAVANERLNQYDLISDEAGTYRIPVEEAMEMMADEVIERDGNAYSPELQLLPGNN